MSEVPVGVKPGGPEAKCSAEIANGSVEQQLGKILDSQAFASSARLKEFLAYTVRQHLIGDPESLKEYSIAVEVFRKPVSYDPAVDSTVRSAAARLRSKLRAYYEVEGLDDPIIIEYPSGHYAPRFSSRGPNYSRVSGGDTPYKANATPTGTRTRRWAKIGVFAAAVAILSAAELVFLVRGRAHTNRDARPNSLAVFAFQNLSDSSRGAWLSGAMGEMFRSELSIGEQIRIIPGEETSRAKVELDLRDSTDLSKGGLTQVARSLGVELVIAGSYVELQNREIHLDIHVQDTGAGGTIATVSKEGTEDQLFTLVSDASSELRSKLRLPQLTEAETRAFRASIPLHQNALELYSKGIEKLRRFEAVEARELLVKAIVQQPGYPIAHSALSEAWLLLGYHANARIEARRALDTAEGLSREARWLIEGRSQEMSGDSTLALATYKTLCAFHPDNPDYTLLLATAQTNSGKGRDALATLAELRNQVKRGSGAHHQDPRIDLAEAAAYESLSEYLLELSAVRSAETTGAEEAKWLVVARARIAEATALWRTGQLAQAITVFDKAKTLFAGVGDRRGVAAALTGIANAASDQGDLTTTEAMYKQSLAIYREIGDQGSLCSALTDLGILLKNRGDRESARDKYEEAITVSREIGDRHGEARALFNKALLLWNDPFPGPLPLYQNALAIFKESGYKTGQEAVLNEMAVWAFNHGELQQALVLFDERIKISRAIGSEGSIAHALGNRANVLLSLGRLQESRESLEAAIAIWKALKLPLSAAGLQAGLANVLHQMGDAGARREYEAAARVLSRGSNNADSDLQASALDVQIGLASLDMEEGRTAEGESALRGILRKCSGDKTLSESELSASIALASCLLQEQKCRESRDAIRQAEAFHRRLKNDIAFNITPEIAIVRAQVRASFGNSVGALRDLEAVAAETRARGYRGLDLQARLAVCEIESKSRQSGQVRRRLSALADEARILGFGLIAGEASGLQRRIGGVDRVE